MGSLKNWYKSSPFWQGVSSAFDLFGISGISMNDLKEIISEERRYNAIKENFDLARKDMELKLKEYDQKIKGNKKTSG